ncbi:MAG TPA: hypothetical protein PJ991_12760 [Kiritimatiellia bacterium]|nr:hypothetical protein [Kiritimatiellia bacterium]
MDIVRKKKLERLGLYALMLLIGMAFVAMFLVIFDPRTGYTPPSQFDQPDHAVADGEFGIPRREMNIHAQESAPEMRSETGGVMSARRVLIPKLPGNLAPNVSADRPLPIPVATPRTPRREDEEREDRFSSGWGWLADDIMSKRRDQEASIAEREAEVEDERNSPETGSIFSTERKADAPLFFMSPTFQPGENERASERSETTRETSAEWHTDATRTRTENTDIDMNDRYGRNDREQTSSGLEIRDPFARQNNSEISSRDRAQFPGMGDDVFSRQVSSVDMERERMDRSSRFQSEPSASRIIGDARSDSSRFTSPWSGHSSDSIFNAGGGYMPSGVGLGANDQVFSGAGVFGGDSIFSPSFSGTSYGERQSIGGIGIQTPSDGGGFSGGSRMDSDRSLPRALPW